MTRVSISISAILTGFCIASPALSQEAPVCGVRADIVGKLSKDFRETPMAVGMVNQSAVMEIFVSDTGTWTILATRPDGISCLVSAGEGWDSKTLIAGRDT